MKNSILITGGAGFIGTNASKYFSLKGWDVFVLDNLSRIGVQHNLAWMKKKFKFKFFNIDICNTDDLEKIFKKNSFDMVLHLAAQVAVTKSIEDPKKDFEINALGTLNILECIRKFCPKSFFLNASTNKVYGKMDSIEIVERNGRYEYKKKSNGINEEYFLDFHSPYGCSKGSADQYTIDYSRIYGLWTTTFRQSCIYGPYQYGIEDQGWIAWLTIAVILNKPFKIYGDGKQIRDILYIDDLIEAYELAFQNKNIIKGEVFNIGGGKTNTLSVLELLDRISLYQKKIPRSKLVFDKWRSGDQKVFVCDITKAKKLLNWIPKSNFSNGYDNLYNWIFENIDLINNNIRNIK